MELILLGMPLRFISSDFFLITRLYKTEILKNKFILLKITLHCIIRLVDYLYLASRQIIFDF